MAMLSDKTSEAIDILVGQFFRLNRFCDRRISILQNVFSMPQAAKILHNNHCHLYPLIADLCSEFKDQYNIPTYYPETPGDGRTYTNLSDMMETYLNEVEDTYTMIKMTYQVAKDNDDFNACAFLMRLMRIISIIIGQVYTLRDKAVQMPTDFDSYDRHISSWGIDGIDLTNPHDVEDDD